jgi:hypothetical protein
MAIKINGNTVIADNQAFTTTSTISATGNITGGNLSVIGTITAAGINTGSSPISTTGNVVGGNILTGGVVSATGNITGNFILGNGSQLTGIDATSIQSGTSNVRVVSSGGNVAMGVGGTANVVVVATSGQFVTGVNSVSGNIDGGNLRTAGLISATGTITGGNVSTAGTMSATGNITGSNLLINGNAQITGNLSVLGTETIFNVANLTVNDKDIIVANNVTGGANVDGSGLQAGNPATATWFFNNATTSWQSNIGITPTANGTLSLGGASNYWGNAFLTTATVTGNVQGGNLRTAGLISATGAITGAALTGTSLTVSTGNITGGNLLLSGAILDSAQLDIQTTASNANIALAPNGTGVVTVSTQVSAVGNVTGGNIRTAGLISATGTVTGSQFNGSGAGLTSIPNGALTNSAVTVNGTSISLGGSGTVTANAATLTGTVLNATVVTTSITSTGALNSGSITSGFGTIDIGTDAITCGGIVNANANGVGNIGSSTTYFNTVFAKATSAQYADLAEKYTADAEYAPGTVVVFGGSAEVTVDAVDGDRRVAGVVSTNPSYIMNAGCEGTNVATVALTGRVPCFVVGPVRKGDLMVAAGLGRARAEADPRVGTVIGKALEDHDGAEGTIEVVVGRF